MIQGEKPLLVLFILVPLYYYNSFFFFLFFLPSDEDEHDDDNAESAVTDTRTVDGWKNVVMLLLNYLSGNLPEVRGCNRKVFGTPFFV